MMTNLMTANTLSLFISNVDPDIEIKKEHENREVENRIKKPRANSVTASFEKEMEKKNGDVAGDVAAE